MDGNRYLGADDYDVIERFIDILSHGLWTAPVASRRAEEYVPGPR
jgi:hypothetical protein